ncbi:thioredoxin family protein [Candidatus Peregrinibacteria bacterium]|nr:MAG: thioredoxin family protein [Candidatus Peregrinibacteria bacterium]
MTILLKSAIFGIGAFVFFLLPSPLFAAQEEPIIYVYSQETCGVCQSLFEFLESEYPNVEVQKLDIHANSDIGEDFNAFAEYFELSKSTPLALVGKIVINGFGNGDRFRTALDISDTYLTPEEAMSDPCVRVFGRAEPVDQQTCTEHLKELGKTESTAKTCEDGSTCEAPELLDPLAGVSVPFVGRIISSEWSLPALSAFLGLLDGFNPCAMWVLVIFLVTLIQIGDRFKMFLVAGTFLVAEAVMYTIILVAWLASFGFLMELDFAGMKEIISAAVGVIAIGAGGFFLWEGVFTDGTCKVTNMKQRQKISVRIQNIAKNPINWGMFVTILGLALSVNIIEFACSVGYPQAFTLILTNSGTSGIELVMNIAIYIFMYMFDDLIVFGIALYSIEKIGITHKFSRATNVIGGVLMLLLGLILLINPGLLNF